MKYTFRAGTRLNDLSEWDATLVLTKDTEVEVEGVDSMDVLAEKMATNRNYYALHREQLSHDEEGVRMIDGESRNVTIHVTYGINGERLETYSDIEKTPSRSVKADKVDNSSDANH